MYNQQPDPYGYPVRQNIDPYYAQMQMREQRMAEIERQQRMAYNYPQERFAPPERQPRASQDSMFIPVESEEEAWSYKSADTWTGIKQWFIKSDGSEIYLKWFDANEPKTYRQVYKLSTIEQPAQTEQQENKFDLIVERLAIMEGLLHDAINTRGSVEISSGEPGKSSGGSTPKGNSSRKK